MMREPQLPGLQRDAHDTSAAAADAVAKISGKIKTAVHTFIAARGKYGATDDEITIAFMPSPESSYRKRRTELFNLGVVVDSGRRRKNRFGRDCIVWVLKGDS